MIFPWLSIFDLQNLYSNIRKPFKVTEETFNDFTIVVPVFRNPSYLQNLEYLRRYKDKVIIVSIQGQNKEFDDCLNMLREEGFKVSALEPQRLSELGDLKYVLVKRALEFGVYDFLRKEAVSYVNTKYVCLLDGDSMPEGDLGKVFAVMEKEGLDLVSVKVLPSSKSKLIERMQWIEYNIAMRARHYRPWLTSGACCCGKTSVLKEIMKNHSLYFYGGDIEIGILARRMKKKIGHIDFKVFTNVPNNFPKWFKQRVNWFCGTTRLSVINFDSHLRCPIFLIYMLGLVFLLLPFKWYEIFLAWWVLLLVLLLYIPITFSNWQVRDRYMILFPLYAGFQILILPLLGFLRYIQLLVKYKRAGRIKLHRLVNQSS